MKSALTRAACLSLVLGTAAAQDDTQMPVKDWLNRMSRAMETLSYQGTFVYIHDGRIDTTYIVHMADQNGARERLLSMNGTAREVVRDGDSVTCYLPDDGSVVVDKQKNDRLLPVVPSIDPARLSQYYDFSVEGEDRIAGMPVRIISIKPADGYRYGYRLWLEQHSGMMLRSDLVDGSQQPVEQMMFTAITIGGLIPPAAMRPVTRAEGYKWYRTDNSGQDLTSEETPRWTAVELPRGFKLARYNHDWLAREANPVDHLVYSDGLASVSVYVEPEGAAADEPMDGLSSIGAVNAFTARQDDHWITVVGEVPRVTVESIAQSVRPVKSDAND